MTSLFENSIFSSQNKGNFWQKIKPLNVAELDQTVLISGRLGYYSNEAFKSKDFILT